MKGELKVFFVELKLKKFSPPNKMGVLNHENFDLNELKVKEVKGEKI